MSIYSRPSMNTVTTNDENAYVANRFKSQQPQQQQRYVFGDISNTNAVHQNHQQQQPLAAMKQSSLYSSSATIQQKTAHSAAPRMPLSSINNNTLQQQQQTSRFSASFQQQQQTQQRVPSMSSQSMNVAPDSPVQYLVKPEQFQNPTIDSLYAHDPQYVTDYVQDIYEYNKSIESKYMAPADYMKKQTDITGNMRSILIDWLVEVHESFKLLPETLFLTTNLIDRFLSVTNIGRTKLQLVGITAMLIASKYEEIACPELDEFLHVSARAYSREELLSMETYMLRVLDFNVTVTTPCPFLGRFLLCGKCNQKTQEMAYMLAELAMLEIESLKYTPSMIASCSIYLAQKFLGIQNAWNSTLQRYTSYNEQDLRPCSQMILHITQCQAIERRKSADMRKLQAIIKKYSSRERCRVSDIMFANYSL